jgi:hypothetical protein
LKEPDVRLTKSSIEAEIQRIHRELMYDVAGGTGKKVPELQAELKALRDYVRENKDKIVNE